MDTPERDYQALSAFVVDNPELTTLENRLGDFNLFQVLRSEFAELKHSNVLAWLLNPTESHGLDATFLQKWLMRVTHEETVQDRRPVTPVDIDAWELASVDVRREWNHIDVLIVLNMARERQWIVCVENKVNSSQAYGQLECYRKVVEKEFPKADCRLFIFLTKNQEIPHDAAYISASYHQVHTALNEAVAQRRMSIGQEPRVLIDNYIRLLEEKFMNESDIARLALTIYKKHKRAIDVIFTHRPENTAEMILPLLGEQLTTNAANLGIVMGPCWKDIIRFIPREWDLPGNRHGSVPAWSPSKLQILFEIDFNSDYPRLLVVGGNPPAVWAASLQIKCNGEGFQHLPRQRRTGTWPRFYSEELDILEPDDLFDAERASMLIFDEIKTRLASDNMRKVIETVADELPALDAYHTSQVS